MNICEREQWLIVFGPYVWYMACKGMELDWAVLKFFSAVFSLQIDFV